MDNPAQNGRPRLTVTEVVPESSPAAPAPHMPPQPSAPQPNQPMDNKPQHPDFEHPIKKLFFLIPALVIIISIAVFAYFTRTDYVQRPVPEVVTTQEIPTPSPVATKTPLKDLLFSTETYSFNYPDTLSVYECDLKVHISTFTASDEDLELGLDRICSNLSAQQIIVSIEQRSIPIDVEELELLGTEPLVVGGIDTQKVEYRAESGEGSNQYVQVGIDGQYYLFVLYDMGYETMFSDMLASLKFNLELTVDFTQLDNSAYGYKFQYPSEWSVVTEINEKTNGYPSDLEIRREEGEPTLQSISMKLTGQQENAPLLASQILSSTKSLRGWLERPASEFRQIGGANATSVKGILDGNWTVYTVAWYDSNVIEMTWTDSKDRQFDQMFEAILNSFEFDL